jgi:hypothetical protein
MLLSHHQNAGQNHDIKKANRPSENVAQLKHLGMTVTNQNLIQEKIQSKPNCGNVCYLMPSCLLPKLYKLEKASL